MAKKDISRGFLMKWTIVGDSINCNKTIVPSITFIDHHYRLIIVKCKNIRIDK